MSKQAKKPNTTKPPEYALPPFARGFKIKDKATAKPKTGVLAKSEAKLAVGLTPLTPTQHANAHGLNLLPKKPNTSKRIASAQPVIARVPAIADMHPDTQDLEVTASLLYGTTSYTFTNFPTVKAHTAEARADLLIPGVDLDRETELHSIWSVHESRTKRVRYQDTLQGAVDIYLDDIADTTYTTASAPTALWFTVSDARKHARYHNPQEFLFLLTQVRVIEFKNKRVIEGDTRWCGMEPLLRDALLKAGEVENELMWVFVENKGSVLRSDRTVVTSAALGHAIDVAILQRQAFDTADDCLDFVLGSADVYSINPSIRVGHVHQFGVRKPDGFGHEDIGG
jgi:hypothetical protein